MLDQIFTNFYLFAQNKDEVVMRASCLRTTRSEVELPGSIFQSASDDADSTFKFDS